MTKLIVIVHDAVRFPLPNISSSTKVPLIELEQLVAEWSRVCWSYWNRGFPHERILDHYPTEVGDYLVHTDRRLECLNLGRKEVRLPDGFDLLIFLIDLWRMEISGMMGSFTVTTHFLSSQDPNNRNKRAKRPVQFRLRMDSQSFQRGILDVPDYLGIAKSAIDNCDGLPQDFDIEHHPSLKSMIETLEVTTLRIKDRSRNEPLTGQGELLVVDERNSVSLYIRDVNGSTHKLLHNQFGDLRISKVEQQPQPALNIPIEFNNYLKGTDNRRLASALMRWNMKSREAKDDLAKGRVSLITKLLTTKEAERENLQRYCVRFETISIDSPNAITIRLDPREHQVNAYDLWEHCIASETPLVALNSSDVVTDWAEKDLWKLVRIDETDPFVLQVRPYLKNLIPRMPNDGWIKPGDIRSVALIGRKDGITTLAGATPIVRSHFEGDMAEWGAEREISLLKSKGPLQIVQGPPGTGKTYTATKVVKLALERNPHARVLVTAKEHLPLDHLCESIVEELDGTSHRVVRVRSTGLKPTLSPESVGLAITMEIADGIEDPAKKEAFVEVTMEAGGVASWVKTLALECSTVICTTTLDRWLFETLRNLEFTFDLAIIEEAGKSYPSELLGPIAISREVLLIGDQQQLPPFEISKMRDSLGRVSTRTFEEYSSWGRAGEISRRMVHPSRWDTLNQDEKSSLAEALLNQAGAVLQPFKWLYDTFPVMTDFLNGEFRMFRELSDAVSGIFYPAPFNWRKKEIGGNKYSDEGLPHPWVGQSRLLIVDHPPAFRGGSAEERSGGGSFRNLDEANTAAKLLRNLASEGFEVKVITFYTGQVASIRSLIPKELYENVTTVDAFQGKESDFIILSMVRNNTYAGARRRFGFTIDPSRLNVALSRAREGIAILTSIQHIEETDWEEDSDHLPRFLNYSREFGAIVRASEVR